MLGKEKEKMILKSHSACQSDSNCTTQSQTICKYRECVLCRFFPVDFFFFACLYVNNVFMFIFKLKYESLSFRIW
jgi:hypothetical protein